jgi:hypothetical protein
MLSPRCSGRTHTRPRDEYTTLPSMRISPPSGASRPAMQRSKVVAAAARAEHDQECSVAHLERDVVNGLHHLPGARSERLA